MRSSQAAFDLIVAEEVSSQATYTRKYRRPEWPGASSGATVGIGYDLGQTPKSTVISDWKGRVSDDMLDAMVSACGHTGAAGKAATRRIRNQVDIPWDVAIAVHKERVIPRWEAKVEAALPNTDKLSPDCFGALLSLTFNRGPSFNQSGERYREMRAIKAHMAAQAFDEIPGEFRSMKRLWPNLAGLRRRRDTEAKLFEKGLRWKPPSVPLPRPVPPDVQVKGDPDVWHVQRRLKAMNYNPGVLDGKWGGITGGAISGFINDRQVQLKAPTSVEMFRDFLPALEAELSKAETESPSFTRPISIERKEATEAEVTKQAPEMVPVKRGRLAAVWATIVSVVLAIINAVADYFHDAMAWVVVLKQYAAEAPGWVWWAAGAALAGVMALLASRGASAIVEAFRKGQRA